ncbi:MAG: thioredoxin domain-containing protein [Spirochaetia bacterium]
MSFARNNLDISVSPYLRQHQDNPVWWQEWSQEALEYARRTNRILFVSVGYATCHWCHVMAADAFSDEQVAAYLNEHFLPIKIDREQRPDIDQWLMQFLVQTTGQGGWPLNAFLSPDLEPFFAMTYAATQPRYGIPSFIDILQKVVEFYGEHRDELRSFELPPSVDPNASRESDTSAGAAVNASGGTAGLSGEDAEFARITHTMKHAYDDEHGGFGTSQKFPPHSSLLYQLYRYADSKEGDSEGAELGAMAQHTLEAMHTRGLHDHLQGGFFRYCTDRAWTIPHFEKMLYDQAMLLWSYSLGARLTGREDFRRTAQSVYRCLEETFVRDGLYVSGHDADTDHEEGGTYVWTPAEISEVLGAEDAAFFTDIYDVREGGNFEGKTHLVRRRQPPPAKQAHLRRLEDRLLEARRKRRQPFVDEKIHTGWNALAGAALVHAHRLIGLTEALERAQELFSVLMQRHGELGRVYHSSLDGEVQHQEFLSDYAALSLFAGMLYEDTGEYRDVLTGLDARMDDFYRDGGWLEADNADFKPIPADTFDSPTPSTMSLALMSRLRTRLLTGAAYQPLSLARPLVEDFHNLAATLSRGYFHIIETPTPVDWSRLPAHTVQVPAERETHCYRGVCTPGMPEFN